MEKQEQIPKGKAILHETPSALTDQEWMSLINKEREGLPPCCGNISELRDQIITIAREGAQHAAWNATQFLRAYRVARDGHNLEQLPALMKLVREVAESMGYSMEEVNSFPHEGNGE